MRIWEPVEQVDWFRVRNQEWIDAWSEGANIYPADEPLYEVVYMPTALEISDTGDAAILLLNPKVVNADGEWEAWFFSNWGPGAGAYPSFRELMLHMYDSFLMLSEDKGT